MATSTQSLPNTVTTHSPEYKALVAAADLSGHYGVGVLLESCLADKLAFVERTRRFIRAIAETKVAEKLEQDRLHNRHFSIIEVARGSCSIPNDPGAERQLAVRRRRRLLRPIRT